MGNWNVGWWGIGVLGFELSSFGITQWTGGATARACANESKGDRCESTKFDMANSLALRGSNRQLEPRSTAPLLLAIFELDRAAMRLRDLTTEHQANPGPILLGREKWYK